MIVIAKLSPRRYIVLDVPAEESAWRSTAHGNYTENQPREREGYTYASADIIAGPADWETCDQAAYEHAAAKGKTMPASEWERLQQKRYEQLREVNRQLLGPK